jgi:hypothetical protein
MAGWYEVIADVVANAIRERLVSHTPVRSGHQAVILAHTARAARALEWLIEEGSLPSARYADIQANIDQAKVNAAREGFPVPELPPIL